VDFAIPGCEIRVAAGEYQLAETLTIENGVRAVGPGAKPEDVPLRPTAQHIRLLYVNDPGAWVEGVSLEGAYVGWEYGSALFVNGLGGTVSNCVIRGNETRNDGHGSIVYLVNSKSLLTHCVVTNNTIKRTYHGAWHHSVVYAEGGRVDNCLVAGNKVVVASGDPPMQITGVMDLRAGAVVRNCTIAGNQTSGGLGVIYFSNAAAVVVTNCVIAGNVHDEPGGFIPPLYSGVNRVFASTVDETGVPLNPGCEVADAGAIFKNFTAGDYRLKSGSPAVNFGPRVTEGEVATAGVDLDGNPRIFGERLDNGCYELQHAAGTLFMVR